MPCTLEYQRFVQQHLSPDDDGLSQQEQLTVIRELLAEADAYMMQWVLDRGSR
jgi:hypothetical protein